MLGRALLSRTSWALADQGIVSLGTFAVNIALARHLSQQEYGSFAMIFGFLLLLQVVNTTLVFYPMTIRISASGMDRHLPLGSSMTLLGVLALPLATIAAIGILMFGRITLVVPGVLWFVAWQIQETMRRVLFSDFRFRSAILGDIVSYLGQAVAVVFLASVEMLTLSTALTAMALTSALAGLIQFFQINGVWSRPRELLATARDHWSIGRWSLANSATTALRLNILLWIIGGVSSISAVAEFQAALNIANVLNPLLHGLSNIIPQTAALALTKGVPSAWQASRPYAALGFVPTVAYYALVVISPGTIIAIFYGAGSQYMHVGVAVQVLGVAFIFNYVAEMISAFLHGISAPRTALIVNLCGSAAAIVLAPPLVIAIGWVGVCIALALANAIRLLLSCTSLKRLISNANARS